MGHETLFPKKYNYILIIFFYSAVFASARVCLPVCPSVSTVFFSNHFHLREIKKN